MRTTPRAKVPRSTVTSVGRRQFLVALGKGAVGLAVFGLAACSDDGGTTLGGSVATTLPPVPTTTTRLDPVGSTTTTGGSGAAQVRRVELGIVSAFIVARDGAAAVIDTGTRGSEDAIADGLATLGLVWPAVGHVIFTHHHGDHVGSAAAVMARATSAEAYAGALDIPRLGEWGPVTAVGDGDTVFGLDVIDTPGHTPGHISVLDPLARFLIAGDALNGDPGGGAVLGPNPGFTADMGTAIESARKLGRLDFDDAYFGHGEPLLGGASAAVAALAATLTP